MSWLSTDSTLNISCVCRGLAWVESLVSSITLSKGVSNQSPLFIKFLGFQLHWRHFRLFQFVWNWPVNFGEKYWQVYVQSVWLSLISRSSPRNPWQRTETALRSYPGLRGCSKAFSSHFLFLSRRRSSPMWCSEKKLCGNRSSYSDI